MSSTISDSSKEDPNIFPMKDELSRTFFLPAVATLWQSGYLISLIIGQVAPLAERVSGRFALENMDCVSTCQWECNLLHLLQCETWIFSLRPYMHLVCAASDIFTSGETHQAGTPSSHPRDQQISKENPTQPPDDHIKF